MLVILYRRNEAGQSYYYTIDDRQQNLFNPYSLTVSWGKQPEGGRSKTYVFESLDEKNRMIRSLLGKKLRSYKVLYSYFKELQEKIRIGFDQQPRAAASGHTSRGHGPADDRPRPNRDWAARKK
jgi:predicted DNA-binding WGR domain protein